MAASHTHSPPRYSSVQQRWCGSVCPTHLGEQQRSWQPGEGLDPALTHSSGCSSTSLASNRRNGEFGLNPQTQQRLDVPQMWPEPPRLLQSTSSGNKPLKYNITGATRLQMKTQRTRSARPWVQLVGCIGPSGSNWASPSPLLGAGQATDET